MKNPSVNTKTGVALTLLMTVANDILAGTPPPPPPPPNGAPIDAGAIILLVIGAVVAFEKLYHRNRQKSNEIIPA